MDTGHQQNLVGGAPGCRQAGDEHIDIGLFCSGRPVAAGVGAPPVRLVQIDRFIAQAGNEGERSGFDRVAREESPCLGFIQAVGLAARRARGGQDHAPIDHLVAIVLLEAVFLVLMIARGQFEFVAEFAGIEIRGQHALNAGRLIGAGVVAHTQCPRSAGISVRTDDIGHLRRIRIGVRQDVAEGYPASIGVVTDIVELVPGPRGIGTVDGRRQVDVGCDLVTVAELIDIMRGVDHVLLTGVIAPERRVLEIVQGQAEIGLIAGFIVVLILELEILRSIGRAKAQLAAPIGEIESGIAAAIDILEAIRFIVKPFDKSADLERVAQRRPTSGPGVDTSAAIAATENVRLFRSAFRYRNRE